MASAAFKDAPWTAETTFVFSCVCFFFYAWVTFRWDQRDFPSVSHTVYSMTSSVSDPPSISNVFGYSCNRHWGSGTGSNFNLMVDLKTYPAKILKQIRIQALIPNITQIVSFPLKFKYLPGLVAQSCNSATGGQELWDGWRLLWPQPSGRKDFCGRTIRPSWMLQPKFESQATQPDSGLNKVLTMWKS